MMTTSLTFNYRSTSTLPRREWVVTVRVLSTRSSDVLEGYLSFAVTSPDVLQTSRLVRNYMTQTYPDFHWTEWTVREVVQVYCSGREGRSPLVLVSLLEGQSVR